MSSAHEFATFDIKLRAMAKCLEVVDVFNLQDTLEYWVNSRFPLMKVSFHNNTLWARCFERGGNVRNPYRYIDNNCCNVAFGYLVG